MSPLSSIRPFYCVGPREEIKGNLTNGDTGTEQNKQRFQHSQKTNRKQMFWMNSNFKKRYNIKHACQWMRRFYNKEFIAIILHAHIVIYCLSKTEMLLGEYEPSVIQSNAQFYKYQPRLQVSSNIKKPKAVRIHTLQNLRETLFMVTYFTLDNTDSSCKETFNNGIFKEFLVNTFTV